MQIQPADLLRRRFYFDGEWIEADQGTLLDITEPASGEVVARVPNMDEAETRRAIEATEQSNSSTSVAPPD